MTEIAFVLKAVATLVSTLKKTPSANGKLYESLYLITVLSTCVLYETVSKYVSCW